MHVWPSRLAVGAQVARKDRSSDRWSLRTPPVALTVDSTQMLPRHRLIADAQMALDQLLHGAGHVEVAVPGEQFHFLSRFQSRQQGILVSDTPVVPRLALVPHVELLNLVGRKRAVPQRGDRAVPDRHFTVGDANHRAVQQQHHAGVQPPQPDRHVPDWKQQHDELHPIGIHDSGVSTWSWEFANATVLNCNDDGSGFCFYTDFSNWYAFGDDVESYNFDWRLPTQDEMLDAAAAGLALYHDADPAAGFQPLIGYTYWSLTELKYRGTPSAYRVDLYTGDSFITSKTSHSLSVWVRGVEPATDGGSSGGKGGGKNK